MGTQNKPITQNKRISTKYLMEHLSKYSFLHNKLNNKKLNSITKEYIENNPIVIYNTKDGIDITDGRHRIFMAISIFKMSAIPFIMDSGVL